MKKSVLFFFVFWAALLSVFVVSKALFVLLQPAYTASAYGSLGTVIAAGLSMDLSVSAYLVSPVLLWLIAAQWINRRNMFTALRGYLWFVAALTAIVTVADFMLFPYWGFRLESTPLFYLTSSPKLAFASVLCWQILLGVLAVAALTYLLYRFLSLSVRIIDRGGGCTAKTRRINTVVLAVIAAALIIPIRGGVTVSTMNPGRAYFCNDMNLNRAAQNPMFTLLYSLTHADRLNSEFNFYAPELAREILRPVLGPTTPPDSALVTLRNRRPDIYLIILESFSAQLMPSLGGEAIAVELDSVARCGVSFRNFYAESFRTDRGLATILSGYPSLPSTSVFKFVNKFDNMPSLARELRKQGYTASFIYGGDIDFTNQSGYLRATGYQRLVRDTDFPASLRTGKWGVHDEHVFARALADNASLTTGDGPQFTVIQTSSSHEPFEVPAHLLKDERANAFAYADSCLGSFLRQLSRSPRWSNTLVVITADHWGFYPKGLSDPLKRHHVPLVMTGGALAGLPAVIMTTASQSAIAPTILALTGADNSMFPNARSLLDKPGKGQFAWFSEPEWYCLITDDADEPVIVNVSGHNDMRSTAVRRANAFVQQTYDDLDAR